MPRILRAGLPGLPRSPIARWPIAQWRDAATDFVFPPRCAVCDAGGSLLCDDCRSGFTHALPPRCPRCWAPAESDTAGAATVCDRCRLDPPVLRTLRAAFIFEGALRRAVLAVKYQGLTATAAPIMESIEGRSLDDPPPPPGPGAPFAADLDLVTAVPMAGPRRRRRGHNQAALFGRLLAGRLGLAFHEDALRRRHATPQQARQPSLSARHANVRDAFQAHPARAAGRTILVVDDVTTSGATLNACAAALLHAGARAVDGWAVARED